MADIADSTDSRASGLSEPAQVETDGHSFRWLINGQRVYAAMLERIACARSELVLEFYICKPGHVAERFRSALVAACRRGVRVRLLLDAFGSDEVAGSFWRELEQAGGELRWFNPLQLLRLSFRNHRKLFVADEIAIVGGMNLADEYDGDGVLGGWRDLAIELHGPLVGDLCASFERQWALASFSPGAWRRFVRDRPRIDNPGDRAALLLAGPGCRSAELRRALHRDIDGASRIDVHAAYFLPSRRLRVALQDAARRGAVRVLVPAHGDVALAQLATRHAMRRISSSGLRFFDYLPQMLHSKLLVIDDIVYIGSANLDVRSRLINFELMLRLPSPELAAQARTLFERDLAHTRPSPPPARGQWQRWREQAAYLLLARIDPYLARRKLRMLQ